MSRKSSGTVYGSMPQAAAAEGLTVATLKAAKAGGCPNFADGGRIHAKGLQKWIAENADSIKAKGENLSLKDQKTNEEIRKLKLANDLKEGALVARLAVQSSVSKTAEGIKSFLTQKLENEYPSAVAGMDVAGARVYGKRVNDEILKELQKLGEFWAI